MYTMEEILCLSILFWLLARNKISSTSILHLNIVNKVALVSQILQVHLSFFRAFWEAQSLCNLWLIL